MCIKNAAARAPRAPPPPPPGATRAALTRARAPLLHARLVRAVWLIDRSVQKLVVVIAGQESGKTLERWVFDVRADKLPDGASVEARPEKELTSEIQAIIRQITASVTFLPLLDEACTFDLLVYTDTDVNVPSAWEESDPKYIAKSEEVKLRSFTTKIHKVDAAVSYLAEDD